MEEAHHAASAESDALLSAGLEVSRGQLAELSAELRGAREAVDSARRDFERELAERQQAWEMERAALLAASADPATGDRLEALEVRWRTEASRIAEQTE